VRRVLKIGGIGCGGLVALIIVIAVLAATLSHKSSPKEAAKSTTPTAHTNTTRSGASCLHVPVSTLREIAGGLKTRYNVKVNAEAGAVKIDSHLYAVSARLVGPGMSLGGPTFATWITDSVRAPVVVMSGEAEASQFTVWPNSPYYGITQPAVQASQGCASGQ
jgi:hypothetical protein